MGATQDANSKIQFTVAFQGVSLSDEQQKKIEDVIFKAVREELAAMQLSQNLTGIKASDILSPEGLPTEIRDIGGLDPHTRGARFVMDEALPL
ncbi:hypothetical protein ACIRRI_46015 [Streptomyces mirabilis]|uniref:hypothetical protein n=1 Tax=Streptomyces mirabilis TaxID=68239 RepID=UPI00382720E9